MTTPARRRQIADLASISFSSALGIFAGLIHPVLGVIVASGAGTLFGSVAIGLGASLIALLGAEVVKMGISTVTNPLYLIALGFGVVGGLWARRRLSDDTDETA